MEDLRERKKKREREMKNPSLDPPLSFVTHLRPLPQSSENGFHISGLSFVTISHGLARPTLLGMTSSPIFWRPNPWRPLYGIVLQTLSLSLHCRVDWLGQVRLRSGHHSHTSIDNHVQKLRTAVVGSHLQFFKLFDG
jgi:hypothetical protein